MTVVMPHKRRCARGACDEIGLVAAPRPRAGARLTGAEAENLHLGHQLRQVPRRPDVTATTVGWPGPSTSRWVLAISLPRHRPTG